MKKEVAMPVEGRNRNIKRLGEKDHGGYFQDKASNRRKAGGTRSKEDTAKTDGEFTRARKLTISGGKREGVLWKGGQNQRSSG